MPLRAEGRIDRSSGRLLPGLTVTLLVYQGAYWIYKRLGFHPLANPAAISIAVMVTVLTLTHTPYATYFEGAQFVRFLLYVLDALRITNHAVRGFAVGTAAHGIGTARAFQVSEEAGAFSGLAMGLNGLPAAVMFPLLARLFS